MSYGQQTFRSAHSDTDATSGTCAAGTHHSPHSGAAHSEVSPATASHPYPDTAPACSGPPASVCCSPAISCSAPASCSGPSCCGVTAPASCTSTSVSGSTSYNCPHPSAPAPPTASPSAPATGYCAATAPDHAGTAGQSNWGSSFWGYCSTEHQQSKRGHPATGQCLPCPDGGEGGTSQSNPLSAYCNHSSTQSNCTCPSESSGWHGACCCAHCSACCTHSNCHNQLCNLYHLLTDCWRKAAGAHPTTSCSAPDKPAPAGHPGFLSPASSSNPTDYHCEWPGVCPTAHEDFRQIWASGCPEYTPTGPAHHH